MTLGYEWKLQRKLIGEAKVVFDVGASIGRTVARYLELFPKAKIYAFEPVPSSIKIFKERLPKLEGWRRVEIVEAAVSAGLHYVETLNVYEHRDHHSLLFPSDDFRMRGRKPGKIVDTIKVPAVCLDDFCAARGIEHIDVLKIDVEGSDSGVLLGASELLFGKQISLVYEEMLFWHFYVGQTTPLEIMALMNEHKYFLHSFQAMHHDEDGRLITADAVFLPKP